MKKTLIPLLFAFVGLSTQAQVCVPGTLTAPKNAYILPDSATNFNHGCVGQYYEQILYIKASKDTVINVTTPVQGVITATIDSFVVEAAIGGMPAYLTAESVPGFLTAAGATWPKSNMDRLVIPGDSMACVRVSGTIPMGTTPGPIPLSINLRVYTSNLTSADPLFDAVIPTFYPGRKTDTVTSIGYYSIQVNGNPCWPAAVNDLNQYGFSLQGNHPNPFSTTTQLRFESANSGSYMLTVVNLMGETVLLKEIKAQQGDNSIQIDGSKWSNGFYMYTIGNGKNLLNGKLQIQR